MVSNGIISIPSAMEIIGHEIHIVCSFGHLFDVKPAKVPIRSWRSEGKFISFFFVIKGFADVLQQGYISLCVGSGPMFSSISLFELVNTTDNAVLVHLPARFYERRLNDRFGVWESYSFEAWLNSGTTRMTVILVIPVAVA